MAKKVSDEDKQRAKDMFAQGAPYRQIGAAIGVSAATISNWAQAGGWLRGILPPKMLDAGEEQIFEQPGAPAETMARNTDKLLEAGRRRWADRKIELADMLAEGIERTYHQIFSPFTVKDVKLVGLGGGVQEPRLIEVPLNEPTPADKKALATTLAILVDKASLLAGDATSRTETASLSRGQAEDRMKHIRDELAQRRSEAEQDAAKRKAAG